MATAVEGDHSIAGRRAPRTQKAIAPSERYFISSHLPLGLLT